MMMESSGSGDVPVVDISEDTFGDRSGDEIVILEDELEPDIENRGETPIIIGEESCATACNMNEIFYNGECHVVDLCSVLGICDENSTCQNNKDGPPTCLPFDPCSGNPCASIDGSTCVGKGSGFSCICEDGAKAENDTCDRNPCDKLSCQSCETCYNFESGARCVKKSGFDHSSPTCSDIDECELGYDRCDINSDCVNLIGNYWCQCHVGYAKNNGKCADVDECASENDCDHICENTIGSYACSCNPGYALQSDGHTCEDIDECAAGICGDNASCENIPGSYICECNDFYEQDLEKDFFHCVDVDECAFEEPYCGVNSDCLNNIGFEPTCTCHSGYSSEDGKNCQVFW